VVQTMSVKQCISAGGIQMLMKVTRGGGKLGLGNGQAVGERHQMDMDSSPSASIDGLRSGPPADGRLDGASA